MSIASFSLLLVTLLCMAVTVLEELFLKSRFVFGIQQKSQTYNLSQPLLLHGRLGHDYVLDRFTKNPCFMDKWGAVLWWCGHESLPSC